MRIREDFWDTFNGNQRRHRKSLLKCTLRIAMSTSGNLGKPSVYQAGIPGRAEMLAKESGRWRCGGDRGMPEMR